MRVSEIISIYNISNIVGEAKVVTPLYQSDVKVLVKETESDPLFLICIWHLSLQQTFVFAARTCAQACDVSYLKYQCLV